MGIQNLHTQIVKDNSLFFALTKFGCLVVFLCCTISINGQSTCSNLTDGGAIAGTETGCANPTFDPGLITSTQLPSGGSGAIEYLWMKTTNDPTAPFNSWDIIPGAKGETYDPYPIDITTYYARCSRRVGCSDYEGETNYITKEVKCCNFNATINVADASGCAGNPIGLSVTSAVTGLTYQWETTGGSFDNIASATPTFIMGTPGTYVLSASLSNGSCTEVVSTTITIQSSTNITITPSTDNTCIGSPITLSTNGENNAQYTWSTSGDGSFDDASSPTPSFSATEEGAYTLTVKVDNGNGCSGEGTIRVNVGSLTATADIKNASCGGDDGSIAIDVTGGTAPYSYDWGDQFGNVNALTNLGEGIYIVIITDSKGCSTSISTEINSADDLAATFQVTNASCAGVGNGAIDMTITGGQGPYNIRWDNNLGTTEDLSALPPGAYDVSITDQNGCVLRAVAVVGEESSINIDIQSTNISCNGGNDGAITIRANRGVEPYIYTWTDAVSTSTSATNLPMGNYEITVTDAIGCSNIANINILEPSALAVSITMESSCAANSGVATVDVSGGTPGYTYVWDDAAAQTTQKAVNLSAGTFTVTVTDNNGCTATASTTISGAGGLIVQTESTDITCNGSSTGTVKATVSNGATPYTYQWSNNLPNQANHSRVAAGNYEVTVTDANGCSASASVVVVETAALVISIVTEGACDASTGAATAMVSGGSPRYTYLWSDDSGQQTQQAVNLSSGTYTVTVTDNNGCTATMTTSVATGGITINATPTPTDCNQAATGKIDISISNGIAPFNYQWSSGLSNQANHEKLIAGNYFLTVSDATGCSSEALITVEEPDPLSVTITPNLVCTPNASSATATISGGNPEYAYMWNDASGQTTQEAVNLASGDLSVTVTDGNGCTASATTTIGNAEGLEVTVRTTPSACTGPPTGTATLTSTNGTAPFTYRWANDLPNRRRVTDLLAGTYTATVTDANGCTGQIETTVPFDTNFQITVGRDNATCNENNGRAVVSIDGPIEHYTYLWNDAAAQTTNPAFNLAPGTYTVTVTSEDGCGQTGQVTIESTSTTLSASIAPNVTNSCANEYVGITSTVTGDVLSYDWSASSGSFSGPTDPNPSYITSEGGVQTVTLTVLDNKGCTTTATTTVNITANLGGQITTTDPTTICIDDEVSDIINVSLDGNTGDGSSWLVTNETGEILTVQSSTRFDFNQAGLGIFNIQHISFDKVVTSGILPGNQIADITGCFAFSNTIELHIVGGADCPNYCTIIAPTISSTSPSEVCVDDGEEDLIEVTTQGSTENTAWVITDELSNILALPTNPPFNLEGAGAGICLITQINYKGALPNLQVGNNLSQLEGCHVLSNSITVNRLGGSDCPNYCGVKGGTLSTTDATAICVGDGIDDLVNISLGAYEGDFSTWAITDIHQIVLDLPTSQPFNFENTAGGTVFIWHISSGEALNNLTIGTDLNALTGCVALSSNGIEVNRHAPTAVNINTNVSLTCRGVPVELSTDVTQADVSYEWTTTGGSFSDVNSPTPTYTMRMPGTYTISVTIHDGFCSSSANTTVTIQDDITIGKEITNTACVGINSGRIELQPSGGTLPYSYTWSNSLPATSIQEGLAEGSYHVTVTDGLGCTMSDTIAIRLASTLSLRLETQHPMCNDEPSGNITAIATGGVEPISYIWNGKLEPSNVLNGLKSGRYTVEITDALGCTAKAETQINEPPALTIAIASEAATCNQGGSVIVQVDGGTGVYNYQWSVPNSPNAATLADLGKDNYAVTVTDENGCVIMANHDVGEVGITQCDIYMNQLITTVNGSEGALEMQVTGGSGHIFAWNTGATTANINELSAGTYSATVTDVYGCSCSDTLTLGNPAKIGDFVFEDKNNNGLQDEKEDGLRGVGIELSGTTATGEFIIQTTRSDKTGMYMFIVPEGQYKITITDDLNLPLSKQDAGDDTLDSDIDPLTRMSEAIYVFNGEFYQDLDIGLVPTGFCNNVTTGGTAAADEEICNTYGDPELMYNLTYPTGGSGEIEYLWLSSFKPDYTPGDPDWKEIPNSNEAYFDPSFISTSTYYVRCARRKGCDNYPGETNVIAKKLVSCLGTPPHAEELRVAIIDNQVQLEWTGMVPVENSNFVIERSENGLDFSVLNSTRAHESKSFTKYDYMDKTPPVGENYYRIKTIHPNFDHTYSNIAMAMLKPAKNMRVTLYPNPILNEVTIHFLEDMDETAIVEVANGFGQVIKRVEIEMPTKKYQLDMSNLPGGIYYVKFQNRLLKQHSQKIIKRD